MTKFKTAKAVMNVATFYSPNNTPSSDPVVDFQIAKDECIESLERQLEDIKNLSADKFHHRNGAFAIMPVPVKIELADETEETNSPISMYVEDSHGLVSINFDGHSSFLDDDDSGSQIIITQHNGEVSLRIYSDINLESPTHDIILNKAKISNRKA